MNIVTDFISQGKSLSTNEGRKLINDTESSIIREAVRDPEVMVALYSAMNESSDPFFRRKVMQILAE